MHWNKERYFKPAFEPECFVGLIDNYFEWITQGTKHKEVVLQKYDCD